MSNLSEQEQAEAALRQNLAQGDAALAGVAPVLSHLLATSGQALVTEDLVARMRGMLSNLAASILSYDALSQPGSHRADGSDELAGLFAKSTTLVSHCYAIAMESQLTEELEQRSGIDQALTPLMQELIASNDDGVAELAMAALSAQARFVQSQRRMSLPIGELPAELFHEAISIWETNLVSDDPKSAMVIARLREEYDEGGSRLGLFARLAGALGNALQAALDLEHAGFALFATSLAKLSKQPRELAILSCHENQATRLALTLRSAGLGTDQLRQQFLLIQTEHAVAGNADAVSPETARSMLAGTYSGGIR